MTSGGYKGDWLDLETVASIAWQPRTSVGRSLAETIGVDLGQKPDGWTLLSTASDIIWVIRSRLIPTMLTVIQDASGPTLANACSALSYLGPVAIGAVPAVRDRLRLSQEFDDHGVLATTLLAIGDDGTDLRLVAAEFASEHPKLAAEYSLALDRRTCAEVHGPALQVEWARSPSIGVAVALLWARSGPEGALLQQRLMDWARNGSTQERRRLVFAAEESHGRIAELKAPLEAVVQAAEPGLAQLARAALVRLCPQDEQGLS